MRITSAPDSLQTLAWLLGMPGQDALSTIEDLVDSYPWLQPAAQQLKTLPLEAWQAEHTRLFINGFPSTVCPPFESAYRHGCMNGPARSELESIYRQIGLEPMHVPADYLGTLLECMAYLRELGSAGEPMISTLWNKHLRLWLPRFCRDLIQHSQLVLYRALGEQLSAIVDDSLNLSLND